MNLSGKHFVLTGLLLSGIATARLHGEAPTAAQDQAAASLRQSLNFNRDWKFQLGDDTNAEAVAFDDSKWSAAGLPHSFSEPTFAASAKFYTGYGWYRKHLPVPRTWREKRVQLEFDGVFQVAEVFVNGRRLGEHRGGYTGFTFDLTPAVQTGDNVVAVRVNNLWDSRLAPRSGEHTFAGGIYRDARLVVTAPLHVAWYGTFVTTPQVSKESGTVNVKTEIVNDSGQAKSATVRNAVLDADGKPVAVMESTLEVPPNSTRVFDQTSQAIANPRLWHPDHPYLYSVKTIVLDGGRPADDFTSPLGFRWFKFTADQGFFLNGGHYYFKGVNVHQDHAGWGDAVADSGAYRDVKMVKDAGFDFIRGSHYPHAPAFAAACDELGVLFWSENCFWGTGGMKSPWGGSAYPPKPEDQPDFDQSVKDSLRDMIRIHRNHPSIIVWSMDNEVFFTDQSTLPRVRELLRATVALAHELDPTRPAGIGGCQRGELDKLGDVAGYNGDGARLFMNPGIPSVVTEYGSTISDRPGNYAPGWGDLQTEQFPWRSGQALWCGFDHASIAGRKFGAMGMIDYFRLPKRQWYWYRNEYKHIPPPAWPANGIPAGLKLTADKTTLQRVDGTDDAQLIVTVVDQDGKAISDCPPVTLAIESGPGEFPTGAAITFAPDSDITIRDGQAAIEFRSYYAGQTLIRATSPGLKDATIELVSLGEPQFIPGKTPPVQPRPYVRFTGLAGDDARSRGMGAGLPAPNSLSHFGLQNPVRVSSAAAGHGGNLAADGDAATFWQAAQGDTNVWLRVDLERMVTVQQTKVTFPKPGNWRYRIELSEDGNSNWKLIVDQSQTASTAPVRNDPVSAAARGRFLRVTFTGLPAGQPAALAEVEALGTAE
jgi:hypothetical protein